MGNPTLVNLARKTEVLQGIHLTSSDDMESALSYIGLGGYSGHIDQSVLPSGIQHQLWIQNATQNYNSMALIGDWIIITNSATAVVCPEALFDPLFAIT